MDKESDIERLKMYNTGQKESIKNGIKSKSRIIFSQKRNEAKDRKM
jgi:hypothetical protein